MDQSERISSSVFGLDQLSNSSTFHLHIRSDFEHNGQWLGEDSEIGYNPTGQQPAACCRGRWPNHHGPGLISRHGAPNMALKEETLIKAVGRRRLAGDEYGSRLAGPRLHRRNATDSGGLWRVDQISTAGMQANVTIKADPDCYILRFCLVTRLLSLPTTPSPYPALCRFLYHHSHFFSSFNFRRPSIV